MMKVRNGGTRQASVLTTYPRRTSGGATGEGTSSIEEVQNGGLLAGLDER